MENIYAALLLHKAGKEVNEDNLKKVVVAAGVEADDAQLKSLVASLNGVDIDKELESASAVSVSAPASGAEKAPKGVPSGDGKEKPKEEKKEAAAEGLSALFG